MKTTLVTYYLQMGDPGMLVPSSAPGGGLEIRRVAIPCPELNRFLYTAVGGDWHWTDRLAWSYERWLRYLDRPELETWVGYQGGNPAGYFELDQQLEAGVEIAYFGLLPQFVGQGLGGRLLTAAVERAWAMGAVRVWVHTCSLDAPGALANYRARGFQIYAQTSEEVEIADRAPGPWPGARANLAQGQP